MRWLVDKISNLKPDTESGSRARQTFIYWARRWKLASTTELSRTLGRDPSAISHVLRQMERDTERPDVRAFRESLRTKQEAICG